MKFLSDLFSKMVKRLTDDETTNSPEFLTQDEILTNVKKVADALTNQDNAQLRELLADPQIIESLKSYIPEQKHNHIRWMEQALLYASGCLTENDGIFSRSQFRNITNPNILACQLLVESGANPRGRVIGNSSNDNVSFYDVAMKHSNLPNAAMYKDLANSLDKQKDDMAFNRMLSIVGFKPSNG